MSNFKLLDPDCVLIHIPKTAGKSIRTGLWKGNYIGPRFGPLPVDWQPLFKFAFVRHPFDRLVSAWKMFTEGTWQYGLKSGERLTTFHKKNEVWSLEEFFAIVTDETIPYDEKSFSHRPAFIRHHTIPQTHPYNCLQYANFVGRFERLDKDFAYVAKQVGIDAVLPKMNYTEHSHWREHIPVSLLDKIYEYYKQDFLQLGYDYSDK